MYLSIACNMVAWKNKQIKNVLLRIVISEQKKNTKSSFRQMTVLDSNIRMLYLLNMRSLGENLHPHYCLLRHLAIRSNTHTIFSRYRTTHQDLRQGLSFTLQHLPTFRSLPCKHKHHNSDQGRRVSLYYSGT